MPGGIDQTIRPFLWRSEQLYPQTEIVSRTPGGIERYTYETYSDRTAQLAHALSDEGITTEDRVGTFCWNHHRHFEAYFGIPTIGAQIHTINPLLPTEHVDYIIGDARDSLIFVDPSLIGDLEDAAEYGDGFDSVSKIVVMGDEIPDTSLEPVEDYESFIGEYPTTYDWPLLDESLPAGMCYTSGTTGKPKGIEYTQKMLWSHTMMILSPQAIPIHDGDVVMPVVPMFHVNAWGLPFATTAAGAKHVYPGPAPSPSDLADLIENEGVTITAGVPTVWINLFEYMNDTDVDLSSLDRVIVGGSAAPEAMIRRFDEYDVELIHAWGMTEMSPVGTLAHVKHTYHDDGYEKQLRKRKTQGLLVPGLEFRVVNDAGDEIERDGESFGELLVRGPTVTTEYYNRPDANEEDFEPGGWLRTGDVVTVHEDGYIEIVDRAKDVIKSGGEWISSVELENTIMAHDDVVEAAVIGVSHDKWQERPVAFVVASDGADHESLRDETMSLLLDEYPKWWIPDTIEFIDSIPKTATGKFSKRDLREQYDDQSLVEGRVPDEAAPDT